MRGSGSSFGVLVGLTVGLATGCHHFSKRTVVLPPNGTPVELSKTTLAEHVIEAPDVLVISSVNAQPRQPYKVQPGDALAINVQDALPANPITGVFPVDPEGAVNLGPAYKPVAVRGLTTGEIKQAIEAYLTSKEVGLLKPVATVAIAQTRGMQQIAGEHLVRADGTVYLGTYGSVRVTGLTLSQAQQAVEAHLATYLEKPEVTLDVASYNSKVFYVIFDGAGVGQQVYRLPITGNETVLDAVSQVNGLGPVSDQNKIWVARATPGVVGPACVLPVDWVGITTEGRGGTNYQLLPGDRLYVKAYTASTLDATLARIFAPVERVLGVTLLGTGVYQQLRNGGNNGGFGNTGAFR